MKKTNLFRLFVLLLVAASTNFALTGCDDDDDSVSCGLDNTPTMTIKVDGSEKVDGSTAAYSFYAMDTTFAFDLSAVLSKIGGDDLKSFSISRADDNSSILNVDFENDNLEAKGVTQSGDSYTVQKTYTVSNVTETVSFQVKFTLTNKEGCETVKTVTFELTKKEAVILHALNLGAYAADTNSFCASIEGIVYNNDDAKTNSGKVDFLYYESSADGIVVGSPKDVKIEGIYRISEKNWAVSNDTKFAKVTSTIDGAAFDALTTSAALKAAVEKLTPSETGVTNLSKDDVLVFKTASTRTSSPSVMGLLKVVGTDKSSTDGKGYISLEIKLMP